MYLFLLTDVDALCAANLKYDTHAPRIDLVSCVRSLKDHIDRRGPPRRGLRPKAPAAWRPSCTCAAELASEAGIDLHRYHVVVPALGLHGHLGVLHARAHGPACFCHAGLVRNGCRSEPGQ